MYVPKSDQEWRTVRQWLTLGLCAVGSLAVVILLARTAVGAITSPPGPWLTAVLSAVGFAAAMTIWRLDDIDRPSVELRTRVWRLMAAWLAALLFGLLVARQSVAGVATVSVVAATWALVGIGFVRSSWLNRPAQPAERAPENPLAGVSGQLGQLEQIPRSVEDDSTERLLLRRRATADGESLEIQARLEFAAGAREAVLHVPLWPALAARPAI
ncbi:MAG: hypothetical protein JNG89_09920, partial [Planctomycetaceae bacterium]|nr:hypothetical protein [Planctomycetaceae bacterium]